MYTCQKSSATAIAIARLLGNIEGYGEGPKYANVVDLAEVG